LAHFGASGRLGFAGMLSSLELRSVSALALSGGLSGF